MSSDAYLTFAPGEELDLADWEAFAAERGLDYDPHVSGGNVYRCGDVQVTFGEGDREPPRRPDGRIDFAARRPPTEANLVIISTYFCGSGCRDVAQLAAAAWHRFGGGLEACPEIRDLVASTGITGAEFAEMIKRNAAMAATEGPGWDGPDDWREVKP